MSYEITLDELETLTPPEDAHPDAPIKISVAELRAFVALIPAARELERTFGTYVVPPRFEEPSQREESKYDGRPIDLGQAWATASWEEG